MHEHDWAGDSRQRAQGSPAYPVGDDAEPRDPPGEDQRKGAASGDPSDRLRNSGPDDPDARNKCDDHDDDIGCEYEVKST